MSKSMKKFEEVWRSIEKYEGVWKSTESMKKYKEYLEVRRNTRTTEVCIFLLGYCIKFDQRFSGSRNPNLKTVFRNKSPLAEKNPTQNFEKPSSDSNSSTSKTFDQTL